MYISVGSILACLFFASRNPVYNPAPVVRKDIMDKYPDIANVLNPIAAKLTTDTMTQLNKSVDVDGKEPVQAACDFLTTNGFMQNCPLQ